MRTQPKGVGEVDLIKDVALGFILAPIPIFAEAYAVDGHLPTCPQPLKNSARILCGSRMKPHVAIRHLSVEPIIRVVLLRFGVGDQ